MSYDHLPGFDSITYIAMPDVDKLVSFFAVFVESMKIAVWLSHYTGVWVYKGKLVSMDSWRSILAFWMV